MEYKLIIQDWVLYDFETVGFISTDATTGLEFADAKEQVKSLRVVGTKKQLRKTIELYNVDEVYGYHPFEVGGKDTNYYEDICWSDDPKSNKPTRKEYNAKYEQDYQRYLKMYRANNNEVLKIRTR
tara:strand:+ start:328 stop:705 length:378 start_codon:yes stop_codon:yes gene_type:complete